MYKILFFLFLVIQNLLSQEFSVQSIPNPRIVNSGFVSDPADILLKEDIQSLNDILIQLEKETSIEFAVVILPSIGESIPKEFAVELFNHWGIGKKEKNNGLLLLLVLDQRRWEIETGYGLEGDLPDIYLKNAGEKYLVPFLKQKDYGNGLISITKTISKKLRKELTQEEIEIEKSNRDAEEFIINYNKNLEKYTILNKRLIWVFALYGILSFFIMIYLQKIKAKTSLIHTEYLVNWKILSLFSIPIFINAIFVYILIGHIIESIYLQLYLYLFSFVSISVVFYFANIFSNKYKDPYSHYKIVDSNFRKDELKVLALLFPISIFFIYIWAIWKRKVLRNTPRFSSKNHLMKKLDEKQDDFFLKEGQKIEEQIGSIDYDVWFCEITKEVQIYAYEAIFTSYTKCPSCKFKTYFVELDEVINSPTCSSSGSGKRHYACKNCSYKTTNTYTIPKRDCSSNSSSSSSSSSYSSSSSSSSSSFGGGRSGGGGAGGSW